MATPRLGASNFNIVQMDGYAETVNSVAITTLQADQDGNILLAAGTTVPTDASSGYAKGATFLLTNAATGVSGRYQNIGTTSSSLFVNTGTAVAGAQTGLVAQVSLSSAQILALNATPITLVAAPGSGKAIVVEQIIFKMVTTATAYVSGGNVTFQYSGGNAVTNVIVAGVVTAGAGTSYTIREGIDVTAAANTAVTITNATGAFTTGTGTAVVTIKYSIITP